MRDYYADLGLDFQKRALMTKEIIDLAFNEKIRGQHQNFEMIQNAYSILSTKEKRKKFDEAFSQHLINRAHYYKLAYYHVKYAIESITIGTSAYIRLPDRVSHATKLLNTIADFKFEYKNSFKRMQNVKSTLITSENEIENSNTQKSFFCEKENMLLKNITDMETTVPNEKQGNYKKNFECALSQLKLAIEYLKQAEESHQSQFHHKILIFFNNFEIFMNEIEKFEPKSQKLEINNFK